MARKGSRKAHRKGSRKANRKGSRKAHRKGSRKQRRAGCGMRRTRRNTRRCGMWGGAYNAMQQSLDQGKQFLGNYPTQREMTQSGGAYGNYSGFGAPVGDQGLLDPALRDMARIQPLDTKLTEIVGMRDPDQMGGSPAMPAMKGGRRRSRKASKKSKKSKKAKKAKKSRRSSRKQRGGSYGNYSGTGQPLSAPNMLLSPSEAARAGTADFSNPLLKN